VTHLASAAQRKRLVWSTDPQGSFMLKIWLPSKLYQYLPVAYLSCGIFMFIRFGNEPLGLISGVIFCTAAALVWGLRIYTAKHLDQQ
jgi:hypothetical protein